MNLNEIINKLPATWTKDLLHSPWKEKNSGKGDPLGHCYVSCETLYYILNCEPNVYHIRHEGSSHWFLIWNNKIIDPTVGQFKTVPNYNDARRKAFLTKTPSKRALIASERIGIKI